ncbi:hypothetical protein SO802_008866 [Lithocarpus litseifolius]|uniref:Uncharacterized protein n=1 Tax=Lithocarpus litseifolius TaxID=425828 RepID=A0AAW2DAV6_9ROSI
MQPPMMENEMIKWFIDNLKPPYYEKTINTQVTHFASLIPIGEHIDKGIRSKKIMDAKFLSSMVEQQVKKMIGLKTKEGLGNLIDNKLIQFDNVIAPNIITNPLPLHQEGNVNAIITVEERTLDFSSSSFPWKAMLQVLVQESLLDLKGKRTSGFD